MDKALSGRALRYLRFFSWSSASNSKCKKRVNGDPILSPEMLKRLPASPLFGSDLSELYCSKLEEQDPPTALQPKSTARTLGGQMSKTWHFAFCGQFRPATASKLATDQPVGDGLATTDSARDLKRRSTKNLLK